MVAVSYKKDAGGPETGQRKARGACGQRLIAAITEIGLRFDRCMRMAAFPAGSSSTTSSRAVRSRISDHTSYAWRAAQAWAGPPPLNASDVRHIFQREDDDAEKRHASNEDRRRTTAA